MASIATGNAGGQHISGEPLTLNNTEKAAPALLRNSIDERIVKVRPMSTPLDQLSRCAGARSCRSMTVEYYAVDTKKTETVATVEYPGGANGSDLGDGQYCFDIPVDDITIFEASDTVLFPSIVAEGQSAPLVAYVYEIGARNSIRVIPINGLGDAASAMPSVPKGTKLVRMGRAATELDVQTPQFQALPHKASNNCQIFKMQVEQSTLQKIAEKEVNWTFSDQEEAAVIDMRLGMEKNFLFGQSAKLFDRSKNEYVYLTGGIWGQTSNTFDVDLANFGSNDLVDLCSRAFTGNNGSKRKILLAGTELMEAISKMQASKVVDASRTFVKWGIEFNEIRSNFGSLYVLHSEVFDACGHAADGMVIDPDYITKYTHIPFHAESLDLRRSGQRNTDAIVLTEASCLVLRYPEAHMRIVSK
jgi:hypothetical protein